MKLGIVAPALNEEQVLPLFLERCEEIGRHLVSAGKIDDFVVLIVDDGSMDGTWDVIQSWHARDARFGGVRLSRNFGRHAALLAGFDEVDDADFVVMLDSDLQARPMDIEKLVDAHRRGFEVVFGVATRRDDPLSVRITSWLFYALFSGLEGGGHLPKHEIMTGFGRCALEALRRSRERRRFDLGLLVRNGFATTSVPMEKERRAAGSVKFTPFKRIGLAITSITGFSKLPLRIASILGLLLSVGAIGVALYIVARKVLYDEGILGWASIMVSVIFFAGMQLLVLGILGEYLGVIVDEVKARPIYVMADIVRPGRELAVGGQARPSARPQAPVAAES